MKSNWRVWDVKLTVVQRRVNEESDITFNFLKNKKGICIISLPSSDIGNALVRYRTSLCFHNLIYCQRAPLLHMKFYFDQYSFNWLNNNTARVSEASMINDHSQQGLRWPSWSHVHYSPVSIILSEALLTAKPPQAYLPNELFKFYRRSCTFLPAISISLSLNFASLI